MAAQRFPLMSQAYTPHSESHLVSGSYISYVHACAILYIILQTLNKLAQINLNYNFSLSWKQNFCKK